MEIKYVYDAQGNETAVIVPIEVWNKIKHIDDEKSIEVFQTSKYRGIYKNLELDSRKRNQKLTYRVVKDNELSNRHHIY